MVQIVNNNFSSSDFGFNPFSQVFAMNPSHSGLENIFLQLNQIIQQPRLNPVNENIISSLPEIEISDLSKIPNEKKECVICLTKYELNDKVILLPCTHMFHTECIKSWFKNQDTCPICKIKINESTILGVNENGINENEDYNMHN
jgi:hypothetical protein